MNTVWVSTLRLSNCSFEPLRSTSTGRCAPAGVGWRVMTPRLALKVVARVPWLWWMKTFLSAPPLSRLWAYTVRPGEGSVKRPSLIRLATRSVRTR